MSVKSFTVHEVREPADNMLERADGVVFVREGFSWLAAVFPPIWCLANGLWLVLLGYIIVAGALSVGTAYLPNGAAWGSIAGAAFNLIFAFEANNLSF